MYKKMTYVVALGCICAGAASSVNYDLLGRKGSKMNSPMVYKNIDYSKMKKDQSQIGSSLENKVLAKRSSGLTGNVVALEGAYCNRGLDYSTTYPVPFSLKKYFANGNTQTTTFDVIGGTNGYMYQSNQVFINVPRWPNYSPSYVTTGERSRAYETHYNVVEENYPFTPQNTKISSHYGHPLDSTKYLSFADEVKNYISGRYSIQSWYDVSNYGGVQEFGNVGIHMTVDALPVKMDYGADLTYIRTNWSDQFNPTPENEIASARMYSTIRAAAKSPVVYVGKNSVTNPGSKGPQIYVGVHSGTDGVGNDVEESKYYSTEARNLDNYIYDNRTIEIAAAGNYSHRFNNSHLAKRAHAANAITVGAVDAFTTEIASYTSSVSKYCTKGIGNCADGKNLRAGSNKPEVFNYSHFYLNDKKRTYTSWDNGGVNTYPPLYDGTEIAAAYTASMVADMLTVNPFYRWHPEVVKAVLISSGYNALQGSIAPYTPASNDVPTYYSLIFDKDHNNSYHDSRYWIGDMNKLYTHVTSSKKEIRFSIKRPANKTKFTAAIAWLTSGNDIANLGKIPQDFDMYVYENTTANVNNITLGNYKAYSTKSSNSYEYVSFTSEAEYLTFRIRLFDDDSRSENNGQVVLGFDLAALRF